MGMKLRLSDKAVLRSGRDQDRRADSPWRSATRLAGCTDSHEALFELKDAADILEQEVKRGGSLTFGQPVPIHGPSAEFLQPQVVVKGGGKVEGKALGYVEFELFQGPL